MLRDVQTFETIWNRLHPSPNNTNAIATFVRFLEKKLGAEVVYSVEQFPYGYADLADVFVLAEKLREAGVVQALHKVPSPPDEPRLSLWRTRFRNADEENMAGGAAVNDERHALICTLAEALERNIWFEQSDYFKSPITSTVADMSHRRILHPERFAGLSALQRKNDRHLTFFPESKYLWVRGQDLTNGRQVWLPAQTISASAEVKSARQKNHEPLIRRPVTTGLATHPDRTEALLLGALEIIERDAYMISWLNRLSPHRMDLESLCRGSTPLSEVVARCARYRLTPHIIRMPTNAPAYALMAIIEDTTGHAPRLSFGLKAHRDPAVAAEKSILEALRARRGARTTPDTIKQIDTKNIGHYDRITYWAQGDTYKKLLFLLEGTVENRTIEPWEHDTSKQHLERIVQWCSVQGYGCASVPFTSSKVNVTPWHIEMVVIPELQPLYYAESMPHIGGTRLHSIPPQFGHSVRTPFFIDEPHPFA